MLDFRTHQPVILFIMQVMLYSLFLSVAKFPGIDTILRWEFSSARKCIYQQSMQRLFLRRISKFESSRSLSYRVYLLVKRRIEDSLIKHQQLTKFDNLVLPSRLSEIVSFEVGQMQYIPKFCGFLKMRLFIFIENPNTLDEDFYV